MKTMFKKLWYPCDSVFPKREKIGNDISDSSITVLLLYSDNDMTTGHYNFESESFSDGNYWFPDRRSIVDPKHPSEVSPLYWCHLPKPPKLIGIRNV